MKICIFAASYPTHESDPGAGWLRQSVNLLAAREHKVVVVVPSPAGYSSHLIDGVRVFGFRHASGCEKSLPEGQSSSMAAEFFQLILSLPYLLMGMLFMAWLVRRERFDLIDVHSPYPYGPMALIPARLFGAKIVASCHESELTKAQRTPWGRALLAWFLRSANRCGSSNSQVAGEVAEMSGRFPRIIPYRAAASSKLARGTSRRAPHAPATLLFSGHLSHRKGLHYLIKALPLVRKKRNVRLLITGNGECRAEWESLVDKLQLNDVVTFLGHVSGKELGKLYQTCDIFVLPAIFDEPEDTEGLGLVLVDALINGRPVIATPVGGIVEVIKHKRTGLLVPERSETALARAILRLLGDRLLARQLGRAGRDFAEKLFDGERIADELEKLFYQALDTTPPAKLKTSEAHALTSAGAC